MRRYHNKPNNFGTVPPNNYHVTKIRGFFRATPILGPRIRVRALGAETSPWTDPVPESLETHDQRQAPGPGMGISKGRGGKGRGRCLGKYPEGTGSRGILGWYLNNLIKAFLVKNHELKIHDLLATIPF